MVYPLRLHGMFQRLLLLALCGQVSLAYAAPGSILEITATGSLSPAEINRTIAPLFSDAPAPQARYAVDTYLIRYESRYPDGETASITAQLFLPQRDSQEASELYLFAPGSTGLLDRCRVSREHIAGIVWGRYRSHVLAHAGQGSVGLLPDYMGFGNPDRLQLYFSPEAHAHMVLDGMRAVQRIARDNGVTLREEAFLAGYSQGGHAIFAAADYLERYAPELRIAGLIGYGATTDLQALFRDFTTVAPLLIYTYEQLYDDPGFEASAMLSANWAARYRDVVTSQCIGGTQSEIPWTPAAVFNAGFSESLLQGTLADSHPEIYDVLVRRSTGLSGHGLPAIILQGSDDPVVTVASQNRFVQALCEAGSAVRYPNYIGTRHDTRQVGFEETRAWMASLNSGESPASDCADLP